MASGLPQAVGNGEQGPSRYSNQYLPFVFTHTTSDGVHSCSLCGTGAASVYDTLLPEVILQAL